VIGRVTAVSMAGVPTIRSQITFARGACGGVLMTRRSSARKTSSKAVMNLGQWSEFVSSSTGARRGRT
jgi:hypothetical protein